MAAIRQQPTTRNRRTLAVQDRKAPPDVVGTLAYNPLVGSELKWTPIEPGQAWIKNGKATIWINGNQYLVEFTTEEDGSINFGVPGGLTDGDTVYFPDGQTCVLTRWGNGVSGWAYTYEETPPPPPNPEPYPWVVVNWNANYIQLAFPAELAPYTVTTVQDCWMLPGPGTTITTKQQCSATYAAGGNEFIFEFQVTLENGLWFAQGINGGVVDKNGMQCKPGVFELGTPPGPPL